MNAALLVLITKLAALPFMLELFRPIVMLFDAAKLPLSIIVTSLPTAGEAGNVIVTAVLIPVADVFTNS